MIPSDLEVADLLVKLYAYPGEPPIVWDVLEEYSGVCWSAKRVGDVTVVCLRGSVTFRDWIRDLMAFASPQEHSDLGPIHPGFSLGMTSIAARVRQFTEGPLIVAGHSLGAGRGAILAGLLKCAGRPPVRRVAFGEPKPGFAPLAKLLEDIPQVSYRNGSDRHHDLVTDVPLSFPPEEYVHPVALTHVCAPPDSNFPANWGVFSWHHMQYYRTALQPAGQPT